jgi:hypothetical protein
VKHDGGRPHTPAINVGRLRGRSHPPTPLAMSDSRLRQSPPRIAGSWPFGCRLARRCTSSGQPTLHCWCGRKGAALAAAFPAAARRLVLVQTSSVVQHRRRGCSRRRSGSRRAPAARPAVDCSFAAGAVTSVARIASLPHAWRGSDGLVAALADRGGDRPDVAVGCSGRTRSKTALGASTAPPCAMPDAPYRPNAARVAAAVALKYSGGRMKAHSLNLTRSVIARR